MGIFSQDEEPCWSDVIYLEKQVKELKAENEKLKARLRPLEDSYFNGLSSIEIAELAKKSIRITTENRKLEDLLQEIKDFLEEPEFYLYGKDTIHDRILQKITKAEEE